VNLIERRIGLLFAAFLALLAIGATKAAWLGVVKAGGLKRAAVTQQEADIVVPARRGSITDDHGVELAVSEPAMDVAATTYLIKDPPAAAAKLAPLLGKPEDQLLRALARRDVNFVYLARHVPAGKAEQAQKLKLEGLEFIPQYRRTYPLDWSAAQLLGSVGTDGDGLGGLEYMLNKQLKGSDGERKLVKDALGTPIEMRDTTPVERGKTVRLTLDAYLQDQAEKVLAEVGKTWQPKGATAIVMDPNSGAILALANWPQVNANALDEAPDYARRKINVTETD
jgi:cell division protein FtsI/penicillin-binding protein 2